MTTTHTNPANTAALDGLTPAEAADLIRDTRAVIAAVETFANRAGITFAITAAATIAALKAHWPVLAVVTAMIAAVAFLAVLVAVITRIILGDPPEHDHDDAPARPDDARPHPASGSGRPATGSDSATPKKPHDPAEVAR